MKPAIWVSPSQHINDHRGSVFRLPIKVFQHLDNLCLKRMKITAKLAGIEIMEMVVQLPARIVHELSHIHKKIALDFIRKRAKQLECRRVV